MGHQQKITKHNSHQLNAISRFFGGSFVLFCLVLFGCEWFVCSIDTAIDTRRSLARQLFEGIYSVLKVGFEYREVFLHRLHLRECVE